ncbi:MerR family transcriptional regulator [Prescottella equi]|uniref:MerR family transcriptional regulator n=1 Tax=Rhodococcus hoagii TaxID=43767 RepID=UPI00301C45ED
MRISEVAKAVGITPRTVRHYHRLGLLDEPKRLANGYREYDLADLVRLMRVRWLAGAGVPLGSVSSMVTAARDEPSADDLEADLTALIETIEAERRVLATKSARLQEMLDAHREGRPVSPLPDGLALAFSELITGEADSAVRAEFERERDAWELVAISGSAPEEFFEAATRLLTDPDARDRVVAPYRRFAALRGCDIRQNAVEIEALSEVMTEIVRLIFVESGVLGQRQLAAHAEGSVGIPVADLIPDPAQAAVALRVLQRLAAQQPEMPT